MLDALNNKINSWKQMFLIVKSPTLIRQPFMAAVFGCLKNFHSNLWSA